MDPATLTASALTALIRTRQLSAVEATEATLARIDRLNPALNAIVQRRDNDALAEARALDARLAKGEDPGPLAGVPVTVKVNIDQAGFATTNGLRIQADLIATEDSPVVANLRRAGIANAIGATYQAELTDARSNGRGSSLKILVEESEASRARLQTAQNAMAIYTRALTTLKDLEAREAVVMFGCPRTVEVDPFFGGVEDVADLPRGQLGDADQVAMAKGIAAGRIVAGGSECGACH